MKTEIRKLLTMNELLKQEYLKLHPYCDHIENLMKCYSQISIYFYEKTTEKEVTALELLDGYYSICMRKGNTMMSYQDICEYFNILYRMRM